MLPQKASALLPEIAEETRRRLEFKSQSALSPRHNKTKSPILPSPPPAPPPTVVVTSNPPSRPTSPAPTNEPLKFLCRHCGNKSDATKVNCQFCGRMRICPRCNCTFAQSKICIMDNFPHLMQNVVSSNPAPPPAPTPVAKSGPWTCSACTFINSYPHTQCQICHTAEGTPQRNDSFTRSNIPALLAEETKKEQQRIIMVQENTERLHKRLQEEGLIEYVCRDDGSCMFRAVSHQLFGVEDHHFLIRTKLVNFLREKADNYAFYFESKSYFDSYCDQLEEDKTWGDEITLKGLADSLQISIHVITSGEERWFLSYIPQEKAPISIFLSYHAPVHYNSVVIQNTKRVEVSVPRILISTNSASLSTDSLSNSVCTPTATIVSPPTLTTPTASSILTPTISGQSTTPNTVNPTSMPLKTTIATNPPTPTENNSANTTNIPKTTLAPANPAPTQNPPPNKNIPSTSNSPLPPSTQTNPANPPSTQGTTAIPPSTQGTTAIPPSTQGTTANPPSTQGTTANPPSTQGTTANPPSTQGTTPLPPTEPLNGGRKSSRPASPSSRGDIRETTSAHVRSNSPLTGSHESLDSMMQGVVDGTTLPNLGVAPRLCIWKSVSPVYYVCVKDGKLALTKDRKSAGWWYLHPNVKENVYALQCAKTGHFIVQPKLHQRVNSRLITDALSVCIAASTPQNPGCGLKWDANGRIRFALSPTAYVCMLPEERMVVASRSDHHGTVMTLEAYEGYVSSAHARYCTLCNSVYGVNDVECPKGKTGHKSCSVGK